MIEIKGYETEELLYKLNNTIISRSVRKKDKKKVILKSLAGPIFRQSSIYRITHDYHIGSSLNFEGLPNYIELSRFGNSPVIVMDDFGGISLKAYCDGHKIDIGTFFKVAIQCCGIIQYLHSNNIIHCDIKTDNILINCDTMKVQLIDFGASSRLNSESVFVDVGENKEFTLAYVSPEQTGRMNRLVDYRTDFYSLGITFYELLCGVLPFQFSDPAEIVHAHIARQPVAPIELEPTLPEALSKLVLKLISKTAEERYQSAQGLLNDLRAISDLYENHRSTAGFVLGRSDFSMRFTVSQKLYGREQEIKKLLTAYDKAAEGEVKVVMVGGYSGIGKTSLIQEIHKPVVEKKGYFVSGKFDQYKKDTPYSAILQAMGDLVRKIISESDEKIERWKNELLQALGHNAGVLTLLIPELELIIGVQPVVQVLSSEESENRFNESFRSLIKTFCGPQNPVALFIDDLQWADVASLKLLFLLLADQELKHLLFIGAYRDNEVSDSHPLMLKIENLKRTKELEQFHVEPLNEKDTEHLLADTLRAVEDDNLKTLSSIVYNKTLGNPFFIILFVDTLYSEKLIWSNVPQQKWEWDNEKIKLLKITDNVADLLVKKINGFDERFRQLLMVASCLGSEFSADQLLWNLNLTPRDLGELLNTACQANFIYPVNDNYKKLVLDGDTVLENDELQAVIFRFLHDRIQQAAYSILEGEVKSRIHYKTGVKLLEKFDTTRSDEFVFETVNHLNESGDLYEEKIKLAEYNQLAGVKAKNAGAYDAAIAYLTRARDIYIGNNGWDDYHQETFDNAIYCTECLYLSAKNDAAIEQVDSIFGHTVNSLEQVKVYEIKCEILMKMGAMAETIAIGKQLLEKLGFAIPRNPEEFQAGIYSELSIAMAGVARIGKDNLVNMPQMQDETLERLLYFIVRQLLPIYSTDAEYFVWIALKSFNIILENGLAQSTYQFLISYGSILTTALKDYGAVYDYGNIAMEIVGRYAKTELVKWRARYVYTAFCVSWGENPKKRIEDWVDIYAGNLENGDPTFGGYALAQRVFNKIALGYNLTEISTESQKYQQLFMEREMFSPLFILQSRVVIVEALTGKTSGPNSLTTAGFEEEASYQFFKANKFYMALALVILDKLQLFFLNRRYEEAIPYAFEAVSLLSYLGGLISLVEFNFYACLNLLNGAEYAQEGQKAKVLETAQLLLANLYDFSRTNKEMFSAFYFIAKAEAERVAGNYAEAEELYEEALLAAAHVEYNHLTAIANELASSHYFRIGRKKIAETYLINAYYSYFSWGAKVKTDQLEKLHSRLFNNLSKEATHVLNVGSGTSSFSKSSSVSGAIDLISILKASQVISGEIIIGNLLSKMIVILTQNAGAQKAVLLLNENGVFTVRASYEAGNEIINTVSEPVSESLIVPEGIIQYAVRTRESLVLDNASRDERFMKDRYMIAHQPKSVISFPIHNKGAILGCMYLENNLSEGAFTEERLSVLDLLSGQIAVSLENAMLYENLDQKVQDRTRELMVEKKKSDDLLLNILPEEIAEELKNTGKSSARLYGEVSVLFTDFVNFTGISAQLSPEELVMQLDYCFRNFDEIMERNKLEKIKTIGDAYLAVCGLPLVNENHASCTVRAALDILDFIERYKNEKQANNELYFDIRIGIHSGPVVAGIVGSKKFAYDIWGDTVNIASRMESNSEPGKINISNVTYGFLGGKFNCQHRGKVAVKNKGLVDMYFVTKDAN